MYYIVYNISAKTSSWSPPPPPLMKSYIRNQSPDPCDIPAYPGRHVPQASVPIFRTGFFLGQTQIQIRTLSGARSLLLQNRCNFCFSLIQVNRPLRFFVSSYSLDFIIDVRSAFLQSFTLVLQGQLTRCRPRFATVFFLFSLNRQQLFFGLIIFS